jgi:signal-transduction protein with cAMP-binding, CBS, and nucleotidyltransferase domain
MKTTRRLTLQQTVGEVMSDTPVTLPPGARIRDAIRRFTDEGPTAIAIVDATGVLRGLVTMLDLLRAIPRGEAGTLPQAQAPQTVETVMRPGVITLEEGDRLEAALDLLLETRFHALPVVRRYGHGPELVGMLEQRDLLPLVAGG